MALLQLLSLLKAYPELFLAISSFYLFFFISKASRSLRAGLPVSWPLLGHMPQAISNSHRLHDWSTDVLSRSGCTFLVKAPTGTPYDILLTCDPANVNHIFNTNFPNYPKDEDFADKFDFLGDGIFTADKESWRFQRRKAHSLMSAPKFRSFVVETSRGKVKCSLLPLLDHFASASGDRTLDLQDVLLRLTFDITSLLVFGSDPGCLGISFPDVPYANAMDDAQQVVFWRHTLPMSWWKAMRWMRIGPERRYAEAVEVLDRFVEQLVMTRKQQGKTTGGDVLSAYLDSEEEVKVNGFKGFDKFLKDTALNLMVAGRDTISSALSWFFYMVAKNPRVEAKILEEVRLRGDAELSNLVYLHAALCESLRLYPPVPFEHKGVVKPEMLPSGIEANRGTRLLVSSYAMGRMEGVWGKDCMEFRPERWISPETGRVRHEPSYKFFAFISGPRSCVGKDVAFAQMKVVAAAVVGRYQIRVAEGHVVRPKNSIILQMEDGLKVTVSKRSLESSIN